MLCLEYTLSSKDNRFSPLLDNVIDLCRLLPLAEMVSVHCSPAEIRNELLHSRRHLRLEDVVLVGGNVQDWRVDGTIARELELLVEVDTASAVPVARAMQAVAGVLLSIEVEFLFLISQQPVNI